VFTAVDGTPPIRRLNLADGRMIEEVLVTLDDVERRIRYGFPGEPPRGMRSFVGTASVREVTDGDRAFVEWSSEFDTDRKWEAKLIANISAMLAQVVAAVAAEAEREERSRV
jgi:hypothetical protein